MSAGDATPMADDFARRRIAYVIALGLLQTLSTFTIDIYLPAFPQIAGTFDVSESSIQFTFTGAMIGMVLGQFFAGPWSDAVGRRQPMLIATVVHVAASIACALAPSVEMLVAARVLQGAASAATGVIALAIVRDLYSGLPMMRMLASMSLISGMAIAVGPLFGSLLLEVMEWRGVFASLAGYGLAIGLLVLIFIGETLPPERRHPGGLRARASAMRRVASDRPFVGLVLVTSLAWAGMYSYLAASSFLFQRVYGLSELQYGLVFASHALMMLLGTQLGVRIAHRIEPRRIVMLSTAGLGISAIGLLIVGLLPVGPLVSIMVFLWAFTFFLGVNTPCIQTLALARHGGDAGTAASLLNATRQGFGALATPIAGFIGVTSAAPVAAVMVVGQLAAIIILWVVVRPGRLDPVD